MIWLSGSKLCIHNVDTCICALGDFHFLHLGLCDIIMAVRSQGSCGSLIVQCTHEYTCTHSCIHVQSLYCVCFRE